MNWYKICPILSALSPTPALHAFFKHRRRMYKGKDNHVWLACGESRRPCGIWELPMNFEISFHGDHNEITIHVPDLKKPSRYLKNFLHSGRIKCMGDGNRVDIEVSKFWFRDGLEIEMQKGAFLTIGKDCWIQPDVSIYVHGWNQAGITFGKEVLIGKNSIIRNHDKHTILNLETNSPTNPPESVVLGNHLWMTQHITVLKGTHLSDGCIVANLAVLSKDYSEPNCLIAGIPAKVVKRNISWDKRSYAEYVLDESKESHSQP